MSASAGSQIEVADVDQAEFVAFGGRQFAQDQFFGFAAGDEADVYGAILKDDLVGEPLGGFDLLFGQRGSVEVNRAVVVRHVERNGRHVVEADEGGGEHVLAGELLLVGAAGGGGHPARDSE